MKTAEVKKADTRKTSSLVKKYLKQEFGINCTVRSEKYSMGSSLNIEYQLGPDNDHIEAVIKKLQYGAFNSMEDMSYSIDNEGLTIDGYELEDFKHVFVRQDLSEAIRYKLAQFLSDNINLSEVPKLTGEEEFKKCTSFGQFVWNAWNWNNLFYQLFQTRNFVTQEEEKINIISVHFSEKNNGQVYYIYSVDGIEYNTEVFTVIKPVEETKPNIEPVAVEKGKIQVIEYSDKAIAVVGDTKPIKDKLKALGGRFNFSLSCGAGWIFPKSKSTELQTALQS